MLDQQFLLDLLDSLPTPILVADTEHRVVYINKAGVDHYPATGSTPGDDLLACHNARSQAVMQRILKAMQHEQLEEEIIADHADRKVYMRALRRADGTLWGYYERIVLKDDF